MNKDLILTVPIYILALVVAIVGALVLGSDLENAPPYVVGIVALITAYILTLFANSFHDVREE